MGIIGLTLYFEIDENNNSFVDVSKQEIFLTWS